MKNKDEERGNPLQFCSCGFSKLENTLVGDGGASDVKGVDTKGEREYKEYWTKL